MWHHESHLPPSLMLHVHAQGYYMTRNPSKKEVDEGVTHEV